MSWVSELFRWGRRIFIMVKGLAILYFALKGVYRYNKTRSTILLFQVYILFGILALDLILMGFEIEHNVNLVLAVFTVNSLMKLSSAYYMQIKCIEALDLRKYKKRTRVFFGVRLALLIGILIWSLTPVVGLRCTPELYRKRYFTNTYSFSNLWYLCFKPPWI